MESAVVGLVARASRIARDPRAAVERMRLRMRLSHMQLLNALSRRPVVSDGDAVVSMTSYGRRLETVFAALESIARGTVLPGRFILWISEDEAPPTLLDPRLRRLRRRGLEIIPCPDYGPHKKQYPFATSPRRPESVLVTADDDKFYPRGWLAGLLAASAAHPYDLIGYRAHRIRMEGDDFAPYSSWQVAPSDVASFAVMCTGAGGVLLPPPLLDALAGEGEAFREAAPRADDIWVHAVAVRAGIRSRQIRSRRRNLDSVPASQGISLYAFNVRRGGNDAQLATSHGGVERRRILADARVPTGAP